MKTLYFYSDINDPRASDAFRAQLQADGLTFTELRLGADFRKHNVTFPGIQAVIEVDGQSYEEVQTAATVASRFAAAPSALPLPPADNIKPPVTRNQAQTILKNLLENPPTGPNPWNQTQRDQCAYLQLLGLFRDLRNGTVY